MLHQKSGLALGYLKVPDLRDDHNVQRQRDKLFSFCQENGFSLFMMFVESEAHSRNFSGEGWKEMNRFIRLTHGAVKTLVIPDTATLTKDVGLYLIKQHELREMGVRIECVSQRGLNLDQGLMLN